MLKQVAPADQHKAAAQMPPGQNMHAALTRGRDGPDVKLGGNAGAVDGVRSHPRIVAAGGRWHWRQQRADLASWIVQVQLFHLIPFRRGQLANAAVPTCHRRRRQRSAERSCQLCWAAPSLRGEGLWLGGSPEPPGHPRLRQQWLPGSETSPPGGPSRLEEGRRQGGVGLRQPGGSCAACTQATLHKQSAMQSCI